VKTCDELVIDPEVVANLRPEELKNLVRKMEIQIQMDGALHCLLSTLLEILETTLQLPPIEKRPLGQLVRMVR
jgi:hypothetical protein